jgi:hypothetical protein
MQGTGKIDPRQGKKDFEVLRSITIYVPGSEREEVYAA